ncbi:GNAT family N-acetyltransferase [Paenibacillus sp. GSMTC-2017]|nr:GNAT family N-acetyltransferase [Paenibacillus sp. GSMTC-2017]
MTLTLRAINRVENEDIFLMIQEMGEGENGFVNSLLSDDLEMFYQKLHRNIEISQGINLGEGFVPQTLYWFFVDEQPVGYGKLRHHLNERLLEHGGHIGYAIRPSERKKGYGKLALKELVAKAVEKDINKILLTVNEENTPSRKVIEASNGELARIKDGVCNYWITINM